MVVMMKKVGIIGLGNIAKRVANGILCSSNACLYAVASRDVKKAEDFAKTYGVPCFYGSYEQLLRDEEVDLIYICTPNQFHEEHIRMCLRYHKHVICEKPMVQNKSQLQALFAYARQQGCFLMEAHKTIFTPLNQKIKKMIEEGVIGEIHTIRANYCFDVLKDVLPTHWVLNDAFGGCSYDIGVYPICASHYYASARIKKMQVEMIHHPKFSCDFGMEANILYENGIYANLQANWFYDVKDKGKLLLIGDQGMIEIPAYWKGMKAYLHQAESIKEIIVEMESDFEGEVSHAIDCIEHDLLESPLMNEEMSINIIDVVEHILTKGKD